MRRPILQSLMWIVAVLVGSWAVVRIVHGGQNQIYVLVAALVIIAGLRFPSVCVPLVLSAVAFIGLVRRLAGGSTAHVANDPLIAAPLLLLIPLILLFRPRSTPFSLARVLVSATCVIAVADFVLVHNDVPIVASGRALAFLLLPSLMFLVLSRAEQFEVVSRGLHAAKWIILATGLYGIFQFFTTPSWDLRWLRSQIPYNSAFGNPVPGEFRLFGPTESPLSYAALLGVGVLLWISTPGRFVLKAIAVALLCFPLLLTAVRTSVFALIIVLLVWVVRARSRQVLLAVAGLLAVACAAYFCVTAFRPDLVDRFGIANLGSDTSVRARTSLLGSDLLRGVFSAGGGLGSSTTGTYVTDNGYLAAFLEGGFPGGLLFVLSIITIVITLVRNPTPLFGYSLFLVALFLAICEASAPVLQGGTGLYFWMAAAAAISHRSVSALLPLMLRTHARTREAQVRRPVEAPSPVRHV